MKHSIGRVGAAVWHQGNATISIVPSIPSVVQYSPLAVVTHIDSSFSLHYCCIRMLSKEYPDASARGGGAGGLIDSKVARSFSNSFRGNTFGCCCWARVTVKRLAEILSAGCSTRKEAHVIWQGKNAQSKEQPTVKETYHALAVFFT